MTIDMIFDAIASERAYQARRWGQRQWNGTFQEYKRTVGEFLVYMRHYLDQAFRMATCEDADEKTLESLRKVVALGVACFEQHGVPMRNLNTPCVNGRDGQPA